MSDMTAVTLDHLYTLLKGEPGTRKSTEALTYPGPQYWFSYDKKMESLVRPMRLFGIDPKSIQYDDYSDWDRARAKLEKLQVNCPFKTIIVDSITSMGDAVNRQTLKVKYGTTTRGGAEAGKRIGGIAVNTIEDFNAETSAFQELIALTKDIHQFHKVNVILIAHVIQTDQKSPDGKTHFSRQLVTGGKKIAAKIPAYCTEVYHFNIKTEFEVGAGGKYSLLTEHTGDDFARTSLDLPGEIIFGSQNLYQNWILPAIKRSQQNDVKQQPSTTTNQQPTTFTVEKI